MIPFKFASHENNDIQWTPANQRKLFTQYIYVSHSKIERTIV